MEPLRTAERTLPYKNYDQEDDGEPMVELESSRVFLDVLYIIRIRENYDK